MNLKLWIKENNITVAKVAKKLKVTPNTVYRILRGFSPSLEMAVKINKLSDDKISFESLIGKKRHKKLLKKDC